MKQKKAASTGLSGKLSELDAIIEGFRVNAFKPVWQQSKKNIWNRKRRGLTIW